MIEKTIKITVKCFSIVRNKTVICSDHKGPIIFVETESIWKDYRNLKEGE